MITKGIIKEVSDTGIRVSVPALGQLEDNLNFDFKKLPYATVCTLPGVHPNYRVGDVVYVGMEDDNLFKPVILGSLPSRHTSNSDMSIGELDVSVSCKLPKLTKLGGTELYTSLTELNDALILLSDICDNVF